MNPRVAIIHSVSPEDTITTVSLAFFVMSGSFTSGVVIRVAVTSIINFTSWVVTLALLRIRGITHVIMGVIPV